LDTHPFYVRPEAMSEVSAWVRDNDVFSELRIDTGTGAVLSLLANVDALHFKLRFC
jgi:hypothetical protein